MPPLELYDQVSAVADLASLLPRSGNGSSAATAILEDRMRRLDESFRELRQAVGVWLVQQRHRAEDPGDAFH